MTMGFPRPVGWGSLGLLVLLALAGCSEATESTPDAIGTAEPEAQGEAPASEATPTHESMPVETLTMRNCYAFLPPEEREGNNFLCGTVHVPPDPSVPNAEPARLPIVILRATGPEPRRDPIVHVSGGPGIGATFPGTVRELAARYAPLRRERDVILYDQRGAGLSEPYPDCAALEVAPEAAEAKRAELAERLGRDLSEAEAERAACLAGLEAAGMPADSFSTERSVADLLEVMKALGYEDYNLYGISYGTRILLQLLHEQPEHEAIRSVVLDSVLPLPEDEGNAYRAAFFAQQQALFEGVFAACAADPACAEAYPDARADFDALAAALEETPLAIGPDESFGPEDLYRSSFPFRLSAAHIPYQPRLVSELRAGITDTLAFLRSGALPESLGPQDPFAADERLAELELAALDCLDAQELSPASDPNARLYRLFGQDAAGLQAGLEEICGPDGAGPLLEKLEELGPRAFDTLIVERLYYQERPGVNPDLNAILSCAEELAYGDPPEDLRAAMEAAGLPDFYIEETLTGIEAQRADCAALAPGPPAPPTEPRFGETPVLLLSGEADPITPPGMSEGLVPRLPMGRRLLVPGAFHSILGNNGDCPSAITAAFLADPAAPLDAACLEDMDVGWSLPGDALERPAD